MTLPASTFFSAYTRPLLILIILLAFGLRVYKSGAYGVFFDEKYTLVVSQGIVMEGANQKDVFFVPGKVYFTPQEFWKSKTLADYIEANVRGDIGNSPAYYTLLWVWIQIFGLSDFAIRLLSVVFSTAVVGLIFVFVRRHLKSTELALGCALLAAIEPFFVAYSHMARNYSFSFFLTLLATHLFLLICEPYSGRTTRRPLTGRLANYRTGLYVGYGLLVTLSVLSHYLTVTVFLCHGLYLLFFVRKGQLWGRMAVAYGLAFVPITLWFVYGGGKYTFQTLAYQAKLYREAALYPAQNMQYGLVLPATLDNVVKRLLPIAADLFTVTNGLGAETFGYRNLLFALGLGLVIAGLIRRYRQSAIVPLPAAVAVPALLAVGYLVYTIPSLHLLVAAMLPTFAYLLYRGLMVNRFSTPGSLLVLLGMLSLIPTLFLVVMSVRNGHTYGITQRYSGFSFPYAIIFVALLLREVWALPLRFRVSVLAVLALQLGFVGLLLLRIYQDRDPKYTYFSRPRIENPYYISAQAIKQQYTEGDTILYPSHRMVAHDAIERTYSPYSIEDAQLTNLYLPKEARYLQRMDTTQTDRIVLVKGNGQRLTIVDFKGRTFRY